METFKFLSEQEAGRVFFSEAGVKTVRRKKKENRGKQGRRVVGLKRTSHGFCFLSFSSFSCLCLMSLISSLTLYISQWR